MNQLRNIQKGVWLVGAVVAALVVSAVPSFASFDYVNTFTPVQTELETAITALVPIVLVIFAIILGIRLGMSLVRRVAGR